MNIRSSNQVLVLLFIALLSACSPKPQVQTIDTADQLQRFLQTMYRSDSLLFGQHDATLYGHAWSWLPDRSDCRDITGEYPYIVSFDIGNLETGDSLSLDSVPFRLMAERMSEHHARGGIVSVSWHPFNPIDGSDSWTVRTDTTVRALLPDGSEHARLDTMLSRVARFLQDLPCPVLFRPWHEQSGEWFWWGSKGCTREEYKALYRYTHDFLQQACPNKIVWAYSPNYGISYDDYLAYYPGNDCVDLLGIDCYHFAHESVSTFQDHLRRSLDIVCRVAEEQGKIAALTETGLESCVIPDWWTQTLLPVLQEYPLAYVLLWRNAYNMPHHFYVPYAGHPAADDFMLFHNNPQILFVK